MKPRKSFPRPGAAHAGLHILGIAKAPIADAQTPERLQAVGLLAAGAAHDLNNLLGVILGVSEELAMQDKLPVSALARIAEIDHAAGAAKKLTRALLAFSTGPSSPPETVDLNESVRRMGSVLARMVGQRVTWEQHLGSGLSRVELQPGQLEQILMNLVLNARDAMPRGGTLSVETANAYLDEAYTHQYPGVVPGSYVRLSVKDTGCGMDSETQAHVFDPFFTTKACGQGTGLGLATVASIVEKCGGHVAVYSRVGWGTTFHVHFLRSTQPASTLSTPASLTVARSAGTILLAEDSPSLRSLTRRILEGAGYAVLDAGTSEDALALAKSVTAPIDLLLTDVALPGMSGFDLAQKLTAIRPDTMVAFMSGHCEQKKRAMHQTYLEKPFTREELLALVHELMTRNEKPGRFGPAPVASLVRPSDKPLAVS